MAKQPASKGGTTKVRFMLLEAEGTEADLAQIFSAIQSAVKPATTVIQQRLPSVNAAPVALTNATEEADDEVAEAHDADDLNEEAPKRAKPKSVRKPVKPEVLEFDFGSNVSLVEFASRHPNADRDAEKYLIIAAWFKEHRDIGAITTSHIFTSYRILGWSTSIDDFGATLRYLKSQKLMSSGNRGEYLINLLGLDKVKKLANGE